MQFFATFGNFTFYFWRESRQDKKHWGGRQWMGNLLKGKMVWWPNAKLPLGPLPIVPLPGFSIQLLPCAGFWYSLLQIYGGRVGSLSFKGTVLCDFWPTAVVTFYFLGETEDRRGHREERDNGWEIYLRGQWHDRLAPNCCTYFGPSAEGPPTRVFTQLLPRAVYCLKGEHYINLPFSGGWGGSSVGTSSGAVARTFARYRTFPSSRGVNSYTQPLVTLFPLLPLLFPLSNQSWGLATWNISFGSSFVLPSPQHEEWEHRTRAGPQEEQFFRALLTSQRTVLPLLVTMSCADSRDLLKHPAVVLTGYLMDPDSLPSPSYTLQTSYVFLLHLTSFFFSFSSSYILSCLSYM
jgi:hypothetical protein